MRQHIDLKDTTSQYTMSNTEVIIITYLCYNYACNIFHSEKNLIFTIKYLIILTIVPFVGSSLISIIKYLTNTIGMQNIYTFNNISG